MKSRTPLPLVSNAVYHFICSCDAELTYVDKTKPNLVNPTVHVENKFTIEKHYFGCEICQTANIGVTNFKVLKAC